MTEEVTTSIDKFIDYLKTHGETDVATLATALKVGEHVIEEWADVLEKADIVKINYRSGRMFVTPIAVSKDHAEVLKHTINEKTTTAVNELETQATLLGQMNAKLDALSKLIKDTDLLFKRKSGEVSNDLKEIDKIRSVIESRYKEVRSRKEYIDKAHEAVAKEIAALEERAKAISGITSGESEIRKVISDMEEKIKLIESTAKSFNNESEKMISKYRSEVSAIINSIRTEAELSMRTLAEQEHTLRSNLKLIDEYKHASEEISKRVEQHKVALIDMVAKSAQDADAAFSAIEQKFSSANEKLAQLKQGFGDFSKIHEEINKASEDIANIKKERDDLEKEINALLNQSRAILAMSEADIEKKAVAAKGLEERTKKLSRNAASTREKLDKLNDDINNIAK
ncbi:MAG: hypothetical protein QXU16_01475 [Candidatus Micrarchaeaceae archaeon]